MSKCKCQSTIAHAAPNWVWGVRRCALMGGYENIAQTIQIWNRDKTVEAKQSKQMVGES